ncbi:MAG TPA: hypothetical protein VJM83_05820, partial [Nitrospirota bacterium]|nr:hypothetical protein [Nitrospirota bacterium]
MKKIPEIGKLAGLLSRPAVLLAFFAQLFIVLFFAVTYHGKGSSEGCLYCHADKSRMEKDGFPQFFITQARAEKETRMPGVKCIDCHLGDGRSRDKDEAHKGMLAPLLIDKDGKIVPRKGRLDSLVPAGKDRMYALFPKVKG